MAGAVAIDLALEVETSAPYTLRSTFSMPDDGYMFALWTNGTAIDNDPGVESIVTIPGVTATKVFGIDVIFGFEQELNFEIVDGNLVIENLLIKDYPVLIRLEN
jgi:hypothetical protein